MGSPQQRCRPGSADRREILRERRARPFHSPEQPAPLPRAEPTSAHPFFPPSNWSSWIYVQNDDAAPSALGGDVEMHRNRTSVGGEGERGQEQASVVSVVVVVVIAAVRAIVIAGASAAIAIGSTIAIAPMIAIPTMIARHAYHAIAIAGADTKVLPSFRPGGSRHHTQIPLVKLANLARHFLGVEIDDEELVRAMQEALSLGRLTTPTRQRFLRAIKIARKIRER